MVGRDRWDDRFGRPGARSRRDCFAPDPCIASHDADYCILRIMRSSTGSGARRRSALLLSVGCNNGRERKPDMQAVVGAGCYPSLLPAMSDRQLSADGAMRMPRMGSSCADQQRRRLRRRHHRDGRGRRPRPTDSVAVATVAKTVSRNVSHVPNSAMLTRSNCSGANSNAYKCCKRATVECFPSRRSRVRGPSSA